MIRNQDQHTESASLVDLLRNRAAEEPDAELFTFLPDGEGERSLTLTRGELDRCTALWRFDCTIWELAAGERCCCIRQGLNSSRRFSAAFTAELSRYHRICRA